MRGLGRLDFDDAKVREGAASRLLIRSRVSPIPPSQDRESQLATPTRSEFQFVEKSLSGTDLSIVGRILGLAGQEHLSRPYEQSGWVYACITALASAVASVGRRVFDRDPAKFDGARELDSGPLVNLLTATPNAHQSADEFFRAGVTHRRLDGEDVWFLMRANGEPIDKGEIPEMIVPWRGSIVDIVTDRNGFPYAYRWPWRNSASNVGTLIDGASGMPEMENQHHRWFPAHSVVQFRDGDPNNPSRGIGAVEVLLNDLENEYQASRYQNALLSNSGDPGGWIIAKRKMSPENQRISQAKLDEELGNVRNRGRWKFIGDETAQIVKNEMAPKDLEFSTMLAWVRDKVASVMGVPPTIIGIYDRATFRNFETAIRQFWTGPNGVIPYLRSVESTMDARFFSRFSGPESQYRFRFDVDGIEDLQEDISEKVAQAIKASEGGNELSLSAALRLFNVEIPEELTLTDTILVPGTVTTLDAAIAAGEMVGEGGGDDTDDTDDTDGDDPDDGPGAGSDTEGGDESDADGEDKSAEGAAESARDAREQSESNTPGAVTDKARMRSERRDLFKSEQRAFVHGQALLDEKVWKRRTAKYLRAYGRAQIRRIRSFAEGRKLAAWKPYEEKSEFTLPEILNAIALDRREWDDKFTDELGDIAVKTYADASESIAPALNSAGWQAQPFQVTDPEAIEFARTQTARLVEGVNSTLAKKVMEKVQARLATGATSTNLRVALREVLPELTEDLRRVFGNVDARASAIARTETGKAVNGGRTATMKASGVTYHEWSDSGDSVVRESHVHVDGEVRAIGESFSNGLAYPHEPGAPAAEVVNCRCNTIPVDDPEQATA